LSIADACDVFDRPIRTRFWYNSPLAIGVAQNHLLIRIQISQCRWVGEETAFAVRYRQSEECALWATVREWWVIDFHASESHVANETQRTIANQRARQQTGFA